MFRNWARIMVLVALVLVMAACAPAAVPTPTPTKAPAPAPTVAAVPTKAPAAAPTVTPAPTKAPAATQTPPPPTATVKPVTLKLASSQTSSDIAVFVALGKGYFQEQGLNVQLVQMASSTEATAVLANGDLDVMAFSFGAAPLAASDRGFDIKVVAGRSESRPNWESVWIGLRKDLADSGQVKKASDLKGMKVAIQTFGSPSEQMMLKALASGDLKREDVDMVAIAMSEQAVALGNKAVAAVFTMEPYTSNLISAGLATRWLPISTYYGGSFQTGVIYYGPTILKDQDAARRFMVAFLKGGREYLKAVTTKEGRQQMVDIMVKYTALKDPKVYDIMTWTYIDPNGQLGISNVKDQFAWMVEQGQYKGKKTMDDFIDMSYVEYAIQKLGKQ